MKTFFLVSLGLLLTVALGEAVQVKRIQIEGRRWTKTWVIERELEIAPGDTLQPEALTRSRNNLLNLGIFNYVEVTADSEGTVTISLAESWHLWPIIDVNLENTQINDLFTNSRRFFDGVSLDLGVTDMNFIGSGAYLMGLARFGASKGGTASYYTRWLSPKFPVATRIHLRNLRSMNHHAAVLGIDKEVNDVRAEIEIGTRRGAPARVGLKLKYDYIKEEPIWEDGIAPKDKTGLVGIYLVLDRRDVEWYPSKGSFVFLGGDYTGGDRHYFRSRADARAFWSLSESRRPPVVALCLRGGTTSGGLPPWGYWYHGFSGGFRGYRSSESESDGYLSGTAEFRFPLTKIVYMDIPFGTKFRKLPFGLNGLFFIERTELRLGRGRTELFAGGVGLACRVPYVYIVEIDLSFPAEGKSEISVTLGMSL